ncbi:MAG: ExbD/TolR family protein [Planctomycetota bacterium]
MKLERSHDIEAGKFSMAAMSDLAFLLIIFFMVCGHFVDQSAAPVELPMAGSGDESDEMPTQVTISRTGSYLVNDMSVPAGDLNNELKGRIRAAETPTEKTVLVRAERSLDYGKLRPVVDAVDKSGGMLELAVIEE